jgi:hypothetical protein
MLEGIFEDVDLVQPRAELAERMNRVHLAFDLCTGLGKIIWEFVRMAHALAEPVVAVDLSPVVGPRLPDTDVWYRVLVHDKPVANGGDDHIRRFSEHAKASA